MSQFAILRIQKLKAGVAVRRSLKHAFREQDTPNADPERLSHNTHLGAANVDEAMAKFQERLPAKVRSNAVLAVEFLVTGSPEVMAAKTRAEQDAYLHDALAWLQKRHGAENVVYAGIHRDETTPHLYAYVVPLDERGKLNCRAFYGGAAALRDMQTEFAERVGKRHGLERGIEGSKATHQRVSQHYSALSKALPAPARVDVPDPSITERLNPRAYGERVAQAVIEQVQPERQALQERAVAAQAAQRRAEAMEATAKAAQARLEAVRPILDLGKRRPDLLQKMVDTAKDWGQRINAQRAAARAQEQARAAPARGKGQEGPER